MTKIVQNGLKIISSNYKDSIDAYSANHKANTNPHSEPGCVLRAHTIIFSINTVTECELILRGILHVLGVASINQAE